MELVVVLVDTRASANFISTKVVEKLGLKVDKTCGFKVVVGNVGVEKGLGVCKEVCWQVQGQKIIQNFFVLELGRTKFVLGMDWLECLGKIKENFQYMTIR